MFNIQNKKIIDLFIVANFSFLTIDILYAHSINGFAHKAEWIPLGFSIIVSIVLGVNFFLKKEFKRNISSVVGTSSIVVGTLGIYFHLESQFFQSTTLKSLIYTAPLVAPLAYTALGLLLFLNVTVPSNNPKLYGRWIIVLSYIGFLGNFILSVLDHAQNGFFYVSEFIPVISAAIIIIFIPLGFFKRFYPLLKDSFVYFIALQVVVGVLGFILHSYAIYVDETPSLIEKILYGPPVLAPLLYCNLALLMFIGWKFTQD